MTTVDETVTTWQRAQETEDTDALRRVLAPAVVLVSPLTEAFRFRGPDEVVEVFASAWSVISDVHWHTALGDESARALFMTCRARGEAVEEAQLLRFDAAGLVTEITLFGRPLPGLTAVMAGISAPLLRRQGRPTAGRLLGAAVAPLAAFTRLGERRLVPLADPARAVRR
jgi:hypothetical protein